MQRILGLTWLVLALMATPAIAADAAHPEASFRTMINLGFQVIATEAIPPADAQNAGIVKNLTPVTIVTLQKGTSVAVCSLTTRGWVYMQDSELELASICDYRDYSSATPPAAAPSAAAGASPAGGAPASGGSSLHAPPATGGTAPSH